MYHNKQQRLPISCTGSGEENLHPSTPHIYHHDMKYIDMALIPFFQPVDFASMLCYLGAGARLYMRL
jgi:hypothetical protein